MGGNRWKLVILMAVVSLALPTSAPAPSFVPDRAVALPRTGQDQCYHGTSYQVVPCDSTVAPPGQDGEIRAGVWTYPRFTDNGDGTITDNMTGLMWLQETNCMERAYPHYDPGDPFFQDPSPEDQKDRPGDGRVSWEQAVEFVRGTRPNGPYPACGAGYSDWRLPSVVELESLFHAGEDSPESWLAGNGFDFTDAGPQYGWYTFWSSTTSASSYVSHWIVDLNSGEVQPGNFPSFHKVWPVRTAQVDFTPAAPVWWTGQQFPSDDDITRQRGVGWPHPRLVENAEGTVTDRLTGLMWLRDANCMKTHYGFFDGDGTARDGWVSWESAHWFVAGINTGIYPSCGAGYQDWRVPNRKELLSLIDFSETKPSLPAPHPFLNEWDMFSWSSTSDGNHAWWVDVWGQHGAGGGITSLDKSETLAVWPVRDVVAPSPTTLRAGDLIVASEEGILRVDPRTGFQTPLCRDATAEDVAIDHNGDILVAENRTNGQRILRIDSTTFEQTEVASGGLLSDPLALAVAPGGRIYVANGWGQSIVAIDPGQPPSLVYSFTFFDLLPIDLVLEPSGDLLVLVVANRNNPDVWYWDTDKGYILRIDPQGAGFPVNVASFDGSPYCLPSRIAAESPGSVLGVGGCLGDVEYFLRIDLGSGTASTLFRFERHFYPHDVAVDADGAVLVSLGNAADHGNQDDQIFRRNLATQTWSLVSEGGLLDNPGAIAVIGLPEPSEAAARVAAIAALAMIAYCRRRAAASSPAA